MTELPISFIATICIFLVCRLAHHLATDPYDPTD